MWVKINGDLIDLSQVMFINKCGPDIGYGIMFKRIRGDNVVIKFHYQNERNAEFERIEKMLLLQFEMENV